ncbi:MAG: LTA synthase family protein, partial [Lachnospiraceae bacterium]|nr:LTA synthase family protein [Lachnospiraceae bacterium]
MDRQEKTSFTVKNLILFILIPASVMYLFEAYTHNPFVRMKPGIQVLNIILFIIIECMLLFITGRLRLSQRIMCVMFMILGLAEYYLVEFRGVTLLPWDLGSLGTAAEVASGYDYVPGVRAVLCIAGFIILFLLCRFSDLKLKGHFRARTLGALVSAALIVVYTLFVQTRFAEEAFGFYTKLFTPTAISERDGTLTAFLMELQYMNVRKPKGYTKEEAERLLSEYEASPAKEERANIIVVMNEAFSDLSVLGDFKTSIDYMPYVHSLQKDGQNVMTGELNVSIVGGNTPNTEFEFLTGDSLAFLPEGSIPYQQYVDEGIYAMPAYLRDEGYTTVGMHPYYPGGWERERVYPELGFEKSMFIGDFDSAAPKIRGYISDMGCTEQIIGEYEKNLGSKKPFFSFLVTMQNHSPYDDGKQDAPDDVRLIDDDIAGKKEATERYLSLIRESDEAFKALTGYFEGVDEPTVIVLFGDHQPSDSVVRPILKLQGKDTRNLSEEDVEKRYIVPYVIWANYDIGTEHGRDMSANLLGNEVLKKAGAGAYPYRVFLGEVAQSYPVLSAVRTV